jgi:hypothetical protein
MIRKFLIVNLLLIFFLSEGLAQSLSKKGSLYFQFLKDSTFVYRSKVFRPYADIDLYQTRLNDLKVNLNGFSLGIRYKNMHVLALAAHGVSLRDQKKVFNRFRDTAFVNERIQLRYISLLYQYTFINNRYIAIFIPSQLGVGRYMISIENDTRTQVIAKKSGNIIPGSVGTTLVLKPVKWVGISGTGGYRIALDKNPNLSFSGLFYGYGIWLDIQQIIRDTKFYGIVKPRYRKRMNALSSNTTI